MTPPTPAAIEAFPQVESPSPPNGNHHPRMEALARAASSQIRDSEITKGEVWAWGWLLWERRRFLARALVWGLAVSAVVAFLIPKRYESTTRLMPPDGKSSSGLAMLAAMAGKGGLGSLGMGSMAGDLLGA